MNNSNGINEYDIYLPRLGKALLNHLLIIILCMIICGAALLSYAKFFVTPLYQAEAMMYVNNTAEGSATISSSELAAAKSLLDVYIVILKSPVTLEAVIEKADLNYSASELKSIVSASSVDGTEVFRIAVTRPDPAEAKLIADTFSKILPSRIAEIIDGSSVKVVSEARFPTHQSSPNIRQYAMLGALLGFFASGAFFVIRELLDNSIKDDEYLTTTYNIPVLAIIPDIAKRKVKNNYYNH